MTKLKWGMIGGGEGSQIGPAHRLGSGLDDLFEFCAGALDHRPEEGREYAQRLGLTLPTEPTVAGKKCSQVSVIVTIESILSQLPLPTRHTMRLLKPF